MSRIFSILSPAYPQHLVGSWLRLGEKRSLGGLVVFPVAVTEKPDKCNSRKKRCKVQGYRPSWWESQGNRSATQAGVVAFQPAGGEQWKVRAALIPSSVCSPGSKPGSGAPPL